MNSDVEYGEVDVEACVVGEAYRTGRMLLTGSFLCRGTYQRMGRVWEGDLRADEVDVSAFCWGFGAQVSLEE